MASLDLHARRRRLRRPRGWNALAWLVLACGIAASLAVGSVWRTNQRSQAEGSFRLEAATVGSTVTTALRRMDDLTVAARTLVETDPGLDNLRFQLWYGTVAVNRYPGTKGFAYVERVARTDLRAFAAHLRSDPVTSLPPIGSRLEIVPPGKRASYCLVRLAVAGAFAHLIPGAGYDLCAIPGSSAFLAAPGAGGFAAVPAVIPGVGQILIVSTPVYGSGSVPTTSAAEHAQAVGWIVGGFDVGAVLRAAVVGDPALAVTITRGGTPAPTGPSNSKLGRLISVARVGRAPAHTPLRSSFTLNADGHWVVTVARRPGWGWFSPTAQGILLAGGGILVTVLLFLLVQVLARGRARALRMVAEKTEELRYRALHDTLTGLPNRALILDRAQQAIARAHREHTKPAALFLDLDDFKTVNDTFGHAIGDELLQAVATRISGAVREPDTVGRLGGDEFIVLVEGDPRAARPELVAQRLLDVLREPFRLDVLDTGPLSIAASIGIAVGERPDGEALLRDADIALYEAKGAGKHRYAVFREEMYATVSDRLALEIDFHGALERGEFFLEYQPTFDLGEGALIGAEALLRWRHPTRGVVGPSEFVPIAESTGLIVPIGSWVLERACEQAKAWHDAGDEIEVSVNISALQLDDPGFQATVTETLAGSGLPPSSLILEITETALMRDPELVAGRLAGLKSLGIRVAIDDFGTGYSSLAYLQRFPVDALKIDRTFISRIATSADAAALIRTLVQLGRSMKLSTVAEGIETNDQLARLRAEDVELGQGFLFARPLDAEAMGAVLERTRSARRERAGSVGPAVLQPAPAG
jgi:diguanylate cyclase (GGDEF)-like protein